MCLMLASTIQFSHNTPTTNQHTQTMHTSKMVRHHKKGIMPQTPNNAPTYKHLLPMCTTLRVTKRHSNTRPCLKGVSSTRKFSINNVGSMTLAHSTNTHHNCGRTRHNCAQ